MKSQGKSPNGRISTNAVVGACTVLASKAMLRRYKALLRADWTRGTLKKILSLMWDEISYGKPGFPWPDVLNPARPGISGHEVCLSIVEHIEVLSRLAPSWLLP